jgi:hypothetical protein
MQCPACGSDDVRRLSIVFSSGLTLTQSASIVAGGAGGHAAGGVAVTGGRQVTALARQAAPPKYHDVTIPTVLGVLFGVVTLMAFAASVGLGLFLLIFAVVFLSVAFTRYK